ncbi:hypothetical protein BKM32_15320 [Mangrovimonas sp. DI 80]|nr:hypothetical protein BKM32_15320 [Mangrovimonas sp. DI 80]
MCILRNCHWFGLEREGIALNVSNLFILISSNLDASEQDVKTISEKIKEYMFKLILVFLFTI